MTTPDNITKEERQTAFLKIYPTAGTITNAAKALGITARAVNKWLKEDHVFAEKFEESRKEFVEELESIAYGLVKEMAQNRDYKANPTLLIFLLNGNAPEKYKGAMDSSSEARDVLKEFRKISQTTVVTVEDPKSIKATNTRAAQTIKEWEGEKKALAEKFGSLKNDNPDSS